MKFLKELALSLLGFLLFLSLSIFSTAFMLNNTLLNPDFVTSELDRLDVSSLAEEFFTIETATEESNLAEVINKTIADLEPSVKEQVSAATYSIYDYLLGKSQDLDLALTVKNTILSPDFVASLVDKLDIAYLVGEFLSEQLTQEIPEDMGYLVEYVDDAVAEAEPRLKEQARAAANLIVDYLLGESPSLNVIISLESVKESLEDNLKGAFLESPPAELAYLPRHELERYFDEHFEEFIEAVPLTFELDESVLGTEVPKNIATGLTNAEKTLKEVRQGIDYFQLGYTALIGFMVLLVLGIILISRQVKDITRRLGVPCLSYGAIGYAGIFVINRFGWTWLPLPEIPPSFQSWMTQFMANLLAPLATFSLGLLIVGAVLIIVSLVYRPRQS